MRSRSSSACRRACSARSRAASARLRAAVSRLTRTTTPTANGTTTHADAGSTPAQPGAGPSDQKTCANNRTNAPPRASAAGRTGSRTATVYTAMRNATRIGPYG